MFGNGMKRAMAVIALAVLAACGGGDRTPPPEYAEGLWAGRTTSGGTLDGVILDDGRYWLVFGANGVARSMITGTGGMSRRTVFESVDGLDFYFGQPGAYASTLRAEVSSRSAMSGQMYIANVLEGFDLGYVRSYDFPANPNELIGNWQGSASTLQTIGTLAVSIAPGGSFTATLSGCDYGGQIVPNRNGRNVYDFSITSQLSCPYAFTAQGVLVSSDRRLVFTGTTPDQRDAFYAVVQ